MGTKVLLFAPWGYPPQWGLSKYRVKASHPAIRDVREGVVETCSSTMAIAKSLVEAGHEVKAIVLGLDSVLPPEPSSSGADLRERVEEWLRQVVEILLERAGCSELKDRVEAVAAPGMGKFYGYEFRGQVDHIFLRSFKEVHDIIESWRPRLLAFDLTHGVNYQLVASLYGFLAAARISVERPQLLFFNSEPYPQDVKAEACIKPVRASIEKALGPPDLRILEVTRIRQVARLAASIEEAQRLQERGLKDALRELKEAVEGERGVEVEEALSSLASFIKALRQGLMGPCFHGSRLQVENEGGRSLPLSLSEVLPKLCKLRNLVDSKDYWELRPSKVDHDAKAVHYPSAKPWLVVALAAEKVAKRLEELRNTANLEGFASKVITWLRDSGLSDKAVLIEGEASIFSKAVAKAAMERGLGKGEGEVEAEEAFKAWSQLKGLKPEEGAEYRKLSPRNFVAHAGLSFQALHKVHFKAIECRKGERGEEPVASVDALYFNPVKLCNVLKELGWEKDELKDLPCSQL